MRVLPSLRRGWILAALALVAPEARAHLGYPDTTSVTLRRGRPEQMLVGATFGAVMTRDGGQSWRWLCPEALTYGSWRPETYLWQPDGTLLAATGSALIRSRDGGCTWASHPYFSPPEDRTRASWLWPISLVSPDSVPSRLWVSTGRSGALNGVYRSDDGGETFALTSLQSTSAVFPSIQVAPSDRRRLYVSASTPTGLRLYRSEDEGGKWEEILQPFPEYTTSSRPYDFFILKVSDTNPDRLWARVTAETWTYVLESVDGGRTFRSVVHPENQAHDGVDEYLMGIEVSADGDTLWAATPTRLFRVRAGVPRATLLSLPDGNACAERVGDTLFVCGASRLHDWALATTRDDGDSYTPILHLPELQPASASFCPVGTPVHDVCRSRWPQFAPTIEANPALPPDDAPDAGSGDAGTPPPDAGQPDPGPDAGVIVEPPPPTPAPKGCAATGGVLPLAGLLALTLRRSRRAHPENPRP